MAGGEKPMPSAKLTATLIALPALAWFAVAAEVAVRVPATVREFDGYRIKLPYFTQQVVSAVSALIDAWWLAVPALLLWLAATGWLVGWLRHRRGAPWVAFAVVLALLVVPVAAHLLLSAALGLAEIKLIEAGAR
jgi:hypothetical protein